MRLLAFSVIDSLHYAALTRLFSISDVYISQMTQQQVANVSSPNGQLSGNEDRAGSRFSQNSEQVSECFSKIKLLFYVFTCTSYGVIKFNRYQI